MYCLDHVNMIDTTYSWKCLLESPKTSDFLSFSLFELEGLEDGLVSKNTAICCKRMMHSKPNIYTMEGVRSFI